tara:strand:+ start:79405 stop:79869 length:465 start_codon:yes stop_codon:yes gene_type:complete
MLREPVKIRPGRPGQIAIEASGSGTCRSCNLKVSCGQYFLMAARKPRQFELSASCLPATGSQQGKAALTGERSAELLIRGNDLVKYSLLLYLLPLLSVLLAVVGAGVLLLSESLTILATFSVFALSLWGLHKYIKRQDLQDTLSLEFTSAPEKF